MKQIGQIVLGLLVVFILTVYYIFFFAINVNFTEKELHWYNIYEVNDTLIFQEINTQKRDTSIITRKHLYHREYDWLRQDHKYHPHYAELWYRNKALKYGVNFEETMISRGKFKPNRDEKELRFGISYLNSDFLYDFSDWIPKTTDLSISKRKFSQTLIFFKEKHKKHRKSQNRNPQTLYWDKEYGIIKYETYGGKVWERINW